MNVAEELSSVVAKMTTSGSKRDVGDDDDDADAYVNDGDAARRKSAVKMDSITPTLIVTQNICKYINYIL